MNGDMADAPSMALPLDGPTGAITGAANQAVVPFTVTYNRTGEPKPVDGPVGAVTATDRHGLVEPIAVEVEDCGFRMLEPHEAGAAMAFPAAYKVGGSKRDRVRQYGQAVTPPVAALILERAMESLA
jgi:DNA (cytosine-5)-methyltransferase 1